MITGIIKDVTKMLQKKHVIQHVIGKGSNFVEKQVGEDVVWKIINRFRIYIWGFYVSYLAKKRILMPKVLYIYRI